MRSPKKNWETMGWKPIIMTEEESNSMIDYKKLHEIANQKYPMMSGEYFEGEIIDSNEEARHAYIQGFVDGMKYTVDEIKSKHDEKGGE